MTQSPIRQFAIATRLKASLKPECEWTEWDKLKGSDREYPLIKIVVVRGNPNRIPISVGIHGDEPA